MSEGFQAAQREMYAQQAREVDIIITTALIPGKPAPKLITADMVKSMKPGSVIVDMAAERGGNCEGSAPDDTVILNGVTILGPTNLPADVPFHTSQLYAKNIATFLAHLVKCGLPNVSLDDEICRDTLVTSGGEIVTSGSEIVGECACTASI
jgi:NAD(P) transhydrogenase subunit alpha